MWPFQRFKSIQWNRGSSHREPETPRASSKKCSQCKDEPAVGSVQMFNGKYVRVGAKCRRAMRMPRDGALPASGVGPPARHKANDKQPSRPQSGEGRHRR